MNHRRNEVTVDVVLMLTPSSPPALHVPPLPHSLPRGANQCHAREVTGGGGNEEEEEAKGVEFVIVRVSYML